MPSMSFATGLLDGYFGKQAEERDRREKNALEAAKFLMSTGRVRDFNDLLPILDAGTGGTGGKGKPQGFFAGVKSQGAKSGTGGDPNSVLSQFLNPILQAHSSAAAAGAASPMVPAGSGQPGAAAVPPPPASDGGGGGGTQAPSAAPAPVSGTVAAPPIPLPEIGTHPARGPLMSDDEIATAQATQAARKDELLQNARIARANALAKSFQAQNPGMTTQDALEAAYDAVGMKWPVRRTLVSKTAGKPIPGASLPDDAKNTDGDPIEKDDKAYYQPILIQTKDGPEVRYTPGAAPAKPKLFTGQNEQIEQRVRAAHPDWDDTQVQKETGKQADALDRLKQQNMIIRVENGKSDEKDLDTLSDGILTGDVLPSMLSRRSKDFNRLMAIASRKSMAATGKPLNFTQMQLQYQSAQRFVSALNSPQMVRMQTLGKSVVNTIDEVISLGEELKQGGVQLWNRAKRSSIRQVYGNTPQSEAAAQYEVAVNTLKEEFANLVNGGYAPTEPAFKLANSQINADVGLKDLTASLQEAQRLINYRLAAPGQVAPITPSGLFGSGNTPGPAPVAPGSGATVTPPPATRGSRGAPPPNPFRPQPQP